MPARWLQTDKKQVIRRSRAVAEVPEEPAGQVRCRRIRGLTEFDDRERDLSLIADKPGGSQAVLAYIQPGIPDLPVYGGGVPDVGVRGGALGDGRVHQLAQRRDDARAERVAGRGG